MSRPIKFRAWDKTGYGSEARPAMTYHIEANSLIAMVILNDKRADKADRDRFIIMQFTGLTDKNGREIYEGDIVALKGKPDGNRKVIVWDEAHAAFDWEDANGDSWPDGFTGFYDEYEVIGNIYENKDLLEARS